MGKVGIATVCPNRIGVSVSVYRLRLDKGIDYVTRN